MYFSKKKLYKDFIGEVKIYFENNLILNIKAKKNLSKKIKFNT